MADTIETRPGVDPGSLRHVTFDADRGESGLWFITSAEIPGLFVTGLTLADAVSVLPHALDAPGEAQGRAGAAFPT